MTNLHMHSAVLILLKIKIPTKMQKGFGISSVNSELLHNVQKCEDWQQHTVKNTFFLSFLFYFLSTKMLSYDCWLEKNLLWTSFSAIQ